MLQLVGCTCACVMTNPLLFLPTYGTFVGQLLADSVACACVWTCLCVLASLQLAPVYQACRLRALTIDCMPCTHACVCWPAATFIFDIHGCLCAAAPTALLPVSQFSHCSVFATVGYNQWHTQPFLALIRAWLWGVQVVVVISLLRTCTCSLLGAMFCHWGCVSGVDAHHTMDAGGRAARTCWGEVALQHVRAACCCATTTTNDTSKGIAAADAAYLCSVVVCKTTRGSFKTSLPLFARVLCPPCLPVAARLHNC